MVRNQYGSELKYDNCNRRGSFIEYVSALFPDLAQHFDKIEKIGQIKQPSFYLGKLLPSIGLLISDGTLVS